MEPKLKVLQGGRAPLNSDDRDLWELLSEVCENKKPLRDLMAKLYPDARERVESFTRGEYDN